MATKQEVESELAATKRELKQFKEKVLRVARRAKDENEWCDEGFATAMTELDLYETGQVEITVKVVFPEVAFDNWNNEKLTEQTLLQAWRDSQTESALRDLIEDCYLDEDYGITQETNPSVEFSASYTKKQ